MKKTIKIGLIVGTVISIANGLTLGLYGYKIIYIFFSPFRILFSPLMMGCMGEKCFLPWIFVDGLTLIFVSVLFSILIHLNIKHLIRKEKNEKTKFVIIGSIIFIALILLSLSNYFKNVCLIKESCVMTVAKLSNSDSVCKYTKAKFVFDSQNYSNSYESNSYNALASDTDGCYTKLAFIKKDESLCLKSVNLRTQDECYMQLSRVKSDISLCQKIHVGKYDTSDYYGNQMNAYAQWDRDYCYKNIAVLAKDISKCEMIQSNDYKQLCLAILSNKKSYCDNISKDIFMLSQSARNECANYFK